MTHTKEILPFYPGYKVMPTGRYKTTPGRFKMHNPLDFSNAKWPLGPVLEKGHWPENQGNTSGIIDF